jgi:hypothetical protein
MIAAAAALAASCHKAEPATPHIETVSFVTAGGPSATASVTADPGSTYSWTVSGAAIINAGGGSGVSSEGRNSITFAAAAPGVITIRCVASDREGRSPPGIATAEAVPPPSITSLTTQSPSVASGTPATLLAIFSDGLGVIDGGVGVVSSGRPQATPPVHTATAFTLTVTNAAGTRAFASTSVGATAFTLSSSPLQSTRRYHTATLLGTGKVLLVGGVPGQVSTELYDPATSSSALTGSLTIGRYQHSATLLPDGRVLVAGGRFNNGLQVPPPVAEGELYDAAQGTFTLAGRLATPRSLHATALLPDGRVLVAGGYGDEGFGCCAQLRTAELFDPSTARFSKAAAMSTERYLATATVLKDGRVLVAGGFNGDALATAELYDPSDGAFIPMAAPMTAARYEHTATLLADGRVLIAGGLGRFVPGPGGPVSEALATAEIYDPSTNAFAATGSLSSIRTECTSTLLPDGRVLFVGGSDATGSTLATAELFVPATGSFVAVAGNMRRTRNEHAATPLPGGFVLITGGSSTGAGGGDLATTELF